MSLERAAPLTVLSVGELVHTWIVIGAVVSLVVATISFAVLYVRMVPTRSLTRSISESLGTAAVGAAAWYLVLPLTAPFGPGDLYAPVGVLGALAAMVATLSVRASGASFATALVFSLGWSILVFLPVARATFATGVFGISPVDHGGTLALNIAAGAAALGVLFVPRPGRSRESPARLPRGLGTTAVLALLAGWLGWLVAAELAIDEVSTAILVNGIVGAAGGVVGWLAVQRIRHQSTNLGAVVAGMVSGLVAVSAGAPLLSPVAAASSGVIAAGLACIFTLRRVAGTRRQQWYLTGSHLIAGAIGLFMLGLLASDSGFAFTGQVALIQNQVISAVAVAAYSSIVSFLLWFCLKRLSRPGERDRLAQ